MKKYLFIGTLSALLIGQGTRRMGPTGTHDLRWLSTQKAKLKNIPQEELERIVNTELAAHNNRANQMIAPYAVRVERRDGVDATGESLTGTMDEVDEYGQARTQLTEVPGETAFPLRRFQFAAGFTEEFFRKKDGAAMASALKNAQAAHRRKLVGEIRDRMFSPVSYDFQDRLTDNKVFKVQALYNGNGAVPPLSPNLKSFDGTHSHYMGFTGWTADNVRAAVNNTREHSDSSQVEIHIAAADEGAFRNLDGFAPATDIDVRVSVNETVATRAAEYRNSGNRFIGRFDGCDVHVKPWIFDGYLSAVDVSQPFLGIRHPDDREDEGLRMIGKIVSFPLQSDYWGAEFGIGVRRRGGATVAHMAAQAPGEYTDPTGRLW